MSEVNPNYNPLSDWKEPNETLKKAAENYKCKHIKREGESCRLNNNCTYPDCKKETFKTK